MAKTLKAAQTITNSFGDEWDSAILVVDKIDLDYRLQLMFLYVDIYKDTDARTNGMEPIRTGHEVDKPTFLAEFDPSESVLNLKEQAEGYVLTIEDDEAQLIYDQFE